MTSAQNAVAPGREQLLHSLYEAAELEHNLMCTYRHAAFSPRQGQAEGLGRAEAGRGLQPGPPELTLGGARRVPCAKSAVAAFDAIVHLCVTGAPEAFLANVEGPWLHPHAMPVERLVDIAHACPSGAIQVRRKDGEPDEAPLPANLLGGREAGPCALRGPLTLRGEPIGLRATLCRCGGNQTKPFCDGTHARNGFSAD